CKRWDARLLGVVAMALALACESSAPIAAPSTSRADALSASAAAPANAAQIGWEIFGSASATAADGLKIIVTGAGTFVAPAGGGGTSSAATGGGNWETRDASNAVTGSGAKKRILRGRRGAHLGSCEATPVQLGPPGPASGSLVGVPERVRPLRRGQAPVVGSLTAAQTGGDHSSYTWNLSCSGDGESYANW